MSSQDNQNEDLLKAVGENITVVAHWDSDNIRAEMGALIASAATPPPSRSIGVTAGALDMWRKALTADADHLGLTVIAQEGESLISADISSFIPPTRIEPLATYENALYADRGCSPKEYGQSRKRNKRKKR